MTHMTSHIPIAALCLVLAAPAFAQDLPKRAAGLWEISTQMAGMPAGSKSQQCVDEKTDAEMQRRALSGDQRQQCTQKSMKRLANGYEVEAECTSAEGKTMLNSRASGDFSKAYTVDNQLRFDPPRQGMSEMKVSMKAQHMGACPPGMAPGQMRMPGMPAMAPGMSGMDPNAMKGMSPEQMRKMAEEMKKASGR